MKNGDVVGGLSLTNFAEVESVSLLQLRLIRIDKELTIPINPILPLSCCISNAAVQDLFLLPIPNINRTFKNVAR